MKKNKNLSCFLLGIIFTLVIILFINANYANTNEARYQFGVVFNHGTQPWNGTIIFVMDTYTSEIRYCDWTKVQNRERLFNR